VSDLLLQDCEDFLSCFECLQAYFADSELVYGHGADNPATEALSLLCAVLDVDPAQYNDHLQMPVTEQQRASLLTIAQQRLQTRQPLSYLTHCAWFMGLKFYVNQDVLVPRSPFAELIAQQFQPWHTPNAINRVLEIGTGSGCMAIATAAVLPEVEVVATDIDSKALAVAQRNVSAHGLTARVALLQSDVFSAVTGKFDVIISNPPYVSDAEMAQLPREYQHEPDHALRADAQGLAIVDRILQRAADFLQPDGVLFVEVGNSDAVLQAKYPNCPFTWLEFASGGHGVFMLTREQLIEQGFNHE
jgi:ribosomal protein L3 glutamine methyltransferase